MVGWAADTPVPVIMRESQRVVTQQIAISLRRKLIHGFYGYKNEH